MQNIEKCMRICIYSLLKWGALVSRKRYVKPRFWLMLMMVLACVFCCVFASQGQFMAQQAAQIEQLEALKDTALAENANLERKIDFAKTDEYIERVAREELGLLKPGEVRFVTGVQSTSTADSAS